MQLPLRERVNAELARLVEENQGRLTQAQVVEHARLPDTALHADFEKQGLWDDSQAAELARLNYAGRIIRMFVVVKREDAPPVRALVSLRADRGPRGDGKGYRAIEDVLSSEDLKENLLETALMELRAFKRKYAELTELADLWFAMEKVPRPTKQKPEENHTSE